MPLSPVSAYDSKFSTQARVAFFRDSEVNQDRYWQLLPHRIHELVQQFQQCHEPSRADLSALNAAIFCDPPQFLWPSIILLLKHTLHTRQHHNGMEGEEEVSDMHDYMMLEYDTLQLYQNFRTLGWLPSLLSRSIGHILYEVMQQHTVQQVKGNYSEDCLLDILMDWKDTVLLPWIQDLYGPEIYDPKNSLSNNWKSKLEYAIMESFCNARKSEIFDIIADYPDSLPAVTELASVLRKTRMQRAIGTALGEAFRHRLLHPGAQTHQILQVYMNSIKVLRVIDPTDALIDSVTGELTSYLRHRSDTIRCIVTR